VFNDVSTLVNVIFPEFELGGEATTYIFDDQAFS
jgi:hypothetical protein